MPPATSPRSAAPRALVGVAGRDETGRRLLGTLKSRRIDVGARAESRRLPHADQDAHPRRRHSFRQAAGRPHRPRRVASRSTTRRARRSNRASCARVRRADALLVSDYGSGLVRPQLGRRSARGCSAKAGPILVDSRYNLLKFRGMTACTPNESEVEQALEITIGDNARALERAGRDVLEQDAGRRRPDHARQPRHGALRARPSDRPHPDRRLRSDRRRHRRRRHRHRDDDARAQRRGVVRGRRAAGQPRRRDRRHEARHRDRQRRASCATRSAAAPSAAPADRR